MLSNGWEIVLLFMTLSMSLRAIQLQIELDEIKKSDTESSTDKKKSPQYNDGDWMVKLKEPKREMVVAGCNTEGEVVRQIILLGHRPDEVRKITRL